MMVEMGQALFLDWSLRFDVLWVGQISFSI